MIREVAIKQQMSEAKKRESAIDRRQRLLNEQQKMQLDEIEEQRQLVLEERNRLESVQLDLDQKMNLLARTNS